MLTQTRVSEQAEKLSENYAKKLRPLCGSASGFPEQYVEYTIHDVSHWLDFQQPLRDLPTDLNDWVADRLEVISRGEDLKVYRSGDYPERVLAREIRAFAIAELAMAEVGLDWEVSRSKVTSRGLAKDLTTTPEFFRKNIDAAKGNPRVVRYAKRLSRWLVRISG